jgi:pilus assembly protein Flp/PilA
MHLKCYEFRANRGILPRRYPFPASPRSSEVTTRTTEWSVPTSSGIVVEVPIRQSYDCSRAAQHEQIENQRKTTMKQLFKNLMNDESGQDLIEYALIAALIALGAIVAMGSLSNKISNEFNTIGSSL